MTDVNLVSGASGFLEADFNQIKDIIQDGGVNAILTSINQTTTTGNALSVTRDLASASTDSPVVEITQDNAGDDQNALTIQQDGTGNGLVVDGVGTGYSAIFNNGKVGIGTANPSNNLEVNENQNSATTLMVFNENDGTIASAYIGVANNKTDLAGIRLYVTGKNYTKVNEVFDTNMGILYADTDSNGLNIATGGTINNISLMTNNLDRLVVTGVGKVGIGTTSPDSLLSVAATGNSVDSEIRLEATNSGGSTAADSIIVSTSTDGGTAAALYFKTREAGGTISEKMRITSDGNVGIGLSDPASKLHIEGANFDTSGIRQYRTSNTQGWNWIISAGGEYILREGSISTAADYFIVDNTGNVTITGTVKIGAYTLPATDGTNGQVLMTNGSGVLTWTTP